MFNTRIFYCVVQERLKSIRLRLGARELQLLQPLHNELSCCLFWSPVREIKRLHCQHLLGNDFRFYVFNTMRWNIALHGDFQRGQRIMIQSCSSSHSTSPLAPLILFLLLFFPPASLHSHRLFLSLVAAFVLRNKEARVKRRLIVESDPSRRGWRTNGRLLDLKTLCPRVPFA